MSLTPKQQRFVAEYLVDLNATQAATRAGYSQRTAKQQGARLLTNVDVAKAVTAAAERQAKRTEITADQVVRELAKIAFSELTDIVAWGTKEVAFGYDDDGRLLPPAELMDAVVVRREMAPYVEAVPSDQLRPETRGAVAEVALTKDGLRVKMHDKVGALTQIGRHLGMFTDRTELSGVLGVVASRPMTEEEWAASLPKIGP